jgi:hypothetical protein
VNKIRTIGGIAAAGILAVSLAACNSSSSASGQQTENDQQQQDTNSLVTDQPIPHFNFSQIRQTLIDAETISSDGTQTTSFFFQMGDPDPVFSCPSLGMPVANTAQLSNPDQVVNDTGNNSPTGGAALTVGQMDPDGVYAPSSSTGTYVICVNSSGAKYLEYWEGDVMTVTSAATWDSSTHQLQVSGAPTAVIHTSASSK